MYDCVLWPFSTKKMDNWTLFSRILVVVWGGLWWFVCIVSGFSAYAPNSGGDVWWFWFFSGGLWWFAVICGGLSFSHTRL